MFEKVRFMERAQLEIIEIGISLTTFADYFEAYAADLFKAPVARLIERGVRLRCFAVDPTSKGAAQYARDRSDRYYIQQVSRSISVLRKVQNEFSVANLRGRIEMYAYSHMPQFHAMCVDADVESSKVASRGAMAVSNYLPGVDRAACPVMIFYQRSNPQLFETYRAAVRALVTSSQRLW